MALDKRPDWNWNISRFSHNGGDSLKKLLSTLPCHYGDYTVRAGMNQRDQALLMIGWLEMMKQHRLEADDPLEALRKIFVFFLKELSRQLGIGCSERGIMVDCAGLLAQEYFSTSLDLIRRKERAMEERERLRDEEIKELSEIKESAIGRRLEALEREHEKQRREMEKLIQEKDNAIKAHKEKIKVRGC